MADDTSNNLPLWGNVADDTSIILRLSKEKLNDKFEFVQCSEVVADDKSSVLSFS